MSWLDGVSANAPSGWHAWAAPMAALAGLLHDLGKSVREFQERLAGRKAIHGAWVYRHEWVSLRMFLAFVDGESDGQWLARLAAIEGASGDSDGVWLAAGRYRRDGIDEAGPSDHPFVGLPPLAAAVAWLVVTHHGLPLPPQAQCLPVWLTDPLAAVDHSWNDRGRQAEPGWDALSAEQREGYWAPTEPLPVTRPDWRRRAALVARMLQGLMAVYPLDVMSRPELLHRARLALMLGDHYYSSLARQDPRRLAPDGASSAYANNDRSGRPKQFLEEHLRGVAVAAEQAAQAFTRLGSDLPGLVQHVLLADASVDGPFGWQGRALAAAQSVAPAAGEHGAFVVNMASTGQGKTLANMRLAFGLANRRRGARVTYALGLRALTVQTAETFRDRLRLGADVMAVRLGGGGAADVQDRLARDAQALGSESARDLAGEDDVVVFGGDIANNPLMAMLRQSRDDPAALLMAPVLVCTVDHMVPAVDGVRGGRQIAPMLRLMDSDLILDELDDYDLSDLPALSRLVYWAAMMGGKVILSSATMPADLVAGMFEVYLAGRRRHDANASSASIPCIWVDEFQEQVATCPSAGDYERLHARFVAKRIERLQAQPARVHAGILAMPARADVPGAGFAGTMAARALKGAWQLHEWHGRRVGGKRVSLGLMRMANIDSLVAVAQAIIRQGLPGRARLHLCVYHAQFPLFLRSAIERTLDEALGRRPAGAAHSDGVLRLVEGAPEPDQVFLVLASPVCEVGRDWDADWCIAEPSSLRSLLQLGGRVWRHRAGHADPARPNMLVLDANARYYRAQDRDEHGPFFLYPGYESHSSRWRLASHRARDLVGKDFGPITSAARIRPQEPWGQGAAATGPGAFRTYSTLAELEISRTRACMRQPASVGAPVRGQRSPGLLEREEAWRVLAPAPGWAALTGVLPQQQPFRQGPAEMTLALMPAARGLLWHRLAGDRSRGLFEAVPSGKDLFAMLDPVPAPGVSPWGGAAERDPEQVYRQAERQHGAAAMAALSRLSVRKQERVFGWHPWLGLSTLDIQGA